ncbi:hypothetical protein SNEBB_007386 [Seison nebaliae]|nr:hypothetical protein SNEBB_007386 [Seison nebaliae]
MNSHQKYRYTPHSRSRRPSYLETHGIESNNFSNLQSTIPEDESYQYNSMNSQYDDMAPQMNRAPSMPPADIETSHPPPQFREGSVQPKSGQSGIPDAYLPSTNFYKPRYNTMRNYYSNDYSWWERDNVNDVGGRYSGLGKKIDHRPKFWKVEDEYVRGKEYQRQNDECAVKIYNTMDSIDNSRDWLCDELGVVDRFYRLDSKALKTRFDIDSCKRNLDAIKSMRRRLFD